MDQLTRTVKAQLIVFVVIAIVAVGIVGISYVRLPEKLFGLGTYTVTLELSESGNLYSTGNVTYRGTEVGRVQTVRLTTTGVEAELTLDSGVPIPSDLDAQVHSQTAVGEQYVALLPRDATSTPLRDGDVIRRSRTSVPPNINELLGATNRGLEAIPDENLKTVIDESYTAFGGLGPELSRFINGATSLAVEARSNLDSLTELVDGAAPVLDSQTDTADSISAWAANLSSITGQLQSQDAAVAGLLENTGPAAAEAQALLERVKPTLPVILANLVSVGEVAITYRADIEQLLVLLPQGIANQQGTVMANINTNQDYKGPFLDFNTNLNLPPTCSTGFLPAQQRRVPSFQDSPPRTEQDLYCRVPQDSQFNVRGVRNFPCRTVPGKRAATVKECESSEPFVPLNDGLNWKGDPNATLTGQGIPKPPPVAEPASSTAPAPQAPPLAIAKYDPNSGSYLGPDGQVYTQQDLSSSGAATTWQSMLMPPGVTG